MTQAMIMPKKYFFDDNGNPLSFGKVYTYAAGTTNPKTTWVDENKSAENSNPIILNEQGYADVYLEGSYSIKVFNANDEPQWTADPVSSDENSVYFNSISDLISFDRESLRDGQLIYVQYYSTVGDGGGGHFRYSAFSNVTPDDGLIFGTGPGQFLRLYDGPVQTNFYGLDKTGTTNETTKLTAAKTASGGGKLIINEGTYLVSRLGFLNTAGAIIEGESRFKTVLKVASGTTGSILSNTNASSGTSAYLKISDLMIDMNGQNVVAIDFSGVNNSVVSRCRVIGGSSFGTATGTGVKFSAPIAAGAYSNNIENCDFVYCAKGVFWDDGGNNNYVFGGECISCIVGYDTQPASGVVDTPKIFGPRMEGCGIGLNEGAQYGMYFGLRIENSSTADINFTTDSDHPRIVGGYTAVSPTAIANLTDAISPNIESSDFAWYNIEDSASRPRRISGRTCFAAAGETPETHPETNHSAYFNQYTLHKNNQAAEWSNAAGTNRIIGVKVTSSDILEFSGFNRASNTYGIIDIGGGDASATAVRPIGNNRASSGSASRLWTAVYATNGTIQTSDEREKMFIDFIEAAEKRVAKKINFKKFKFKHAVKEKGEDGARTHFGVIAQEVMQAFTSEGLDAYNYGMFCSDDIYTDPLGRTYDCPEQCKDYNPNKLKKTTKLGIRYDELMCFVMAGMVQ